MEQNCLSTNRETCKRFDVKPPSSIFFGRVELLKQMHECLVKTKRVVLVGMAGIGKTQLARKYAFEEQFRSHYKNIVWFNASSIANSFKNSLAQCSSELGLPIKDSEGEFSRKQLSKNIFKYFASENTLYIYDNADDVSVHHLKTCFSDFTNSYTLVTSKCRGWCNYTFLDVLRFTDLEAENFLIKSLNLSNKLNDIINELGGHPLALHQAISYIKNNHISVEEYATLLKERLSDLVKLNFQHEPDENCVYKSTSLILQKLKVNGEKTALLLLGCLSFCNGKVLKQSFLRNLTRYLVGSDDLEVNRINLLLENYSLIHYLSEGLYSIHELTQVICKKFLEEIYAETKNPEDLIISYIKELIKNTDNKIDWHDHFTYMLNKKIATVFKDYLADIIIAFESKLKFNQLIFVLDKICNTLKGDEQELRLSVLFKIADCLLNAGLYKEAKEKFDDIYNLCLKELGHKHLLTLTSKNSLGCSLLKLGLSNNAKKTFEELLEDDKELFEKKMWPSAILTTQHNIACCLQDMGYCSEALEILDSVFKFEKVFLGSCHPSTMKTKYNIARCYIEMERFTDALEIFEETKMEGFLDTSEDISQQNKDSDMSYLTIQHNKGCCLLKMGRYSEAVETFENNFKCESKYLETNHPLTLNTMYNIACCSFKLGNFSEVKTLFQNIYENECKTFGSDHPSAINTLHNILCCMFECGNYHEIMESFKQLINTRNRIFGVNNPGSIELQVDIANYLMETEYFSEAQDLLHTIYNLRKKDFGRKHLLVLDIKQDIAYCKFKKGQFSDAKNILKKVYDINKKTHKYNKTHPASQSIKHIIAFCMLEMGDVFKAKEVFQKLFELRSKSLGRSHPLTLRTENNLGYCMLKTGEFSSAELLFQQNYDEKLKMFGTNHPATLSSQRNLAYCKLEQGDFSGAKSLFETVHDIELKFFSSDVILKTRHNIAVCMLKLGLNENMENFNRILALKNNLLIREKSRSTLKKKRLIPNSHISLLLTQHCVANSMLDLKKISEASNLFKEIKSSFVEKLGKKHLYTLKTEHCIACCLFNEEKFKDALQKLEDLAKKKKEVLGDGHPSTLVTKHNIGCCLVKIGKFSTVKETFQAVEKAYRKTFGNGHLYTIETQDHIAYCKLKLGDFSSAKKKFEFVERKFVRKLGANHALTLTVQHNIGYCLLEEERFEDAKNKFIEVLKKLINLGFSNDHPSVLSSKHNIGYCLMKSGRLRDAYRQFHEVETCILTRNSPINVQENVYTNIQENSSYYLKVVKKEIRNCFILLVFAIIILLYLMINIFNWSIYA